MWILIFFFFFFGHKLPRKFDIIRDYKAVKIAELYNC